MADAGLVAIAETGDKAQVATVVLAARVSKTRWVIPGVTVGMLLASIPVIMTGRWLTERLPLATARTGAGVLFIALAVVTVWATYVNS
ncbi:TMEM165/GDT1 family protein [Marinobacter metalliresistant]|uniref:GDT1 family protein n=1 Tax=Marinobacter metalliresistant TaxID=2961995 RepID=A0ABZ2VYH6_9GAMM